MPQDPTQDEVLEAARGLGKDEFTREDIVTKLGLEPGQLKDGFRAARQAGQIEKVREDESGKGHFRLASG